MFVGGAGSNYQGLQNYLQFNNNLQNELQGAVQRAAAKTLLDQATGLMPPNLDAFLGTGGCMPGGVLDPSMACGRGGMPTYLSNQQLGEEMSVERVQVDGAQQSKKGAGVQPTVQDKPVKLTPQQVEAKIATDPMFRAKMEQKLGGRIMLDGNADGNITVERPFPFAGGMPPGLGNMQQACMGHMNRMDATFGAALGAALGQQLMQQSAAQLAQQFVGGCTGPFMPQQNALAAAYQAGQASGFAQGYQAGLLGGTQGMPGVCGNSFPGLPSPAQLGSALEQMMSNVVGMHGCLANTAAVFAQAQDSLAAWRAQALTLPRN